MTPPPPGALWRAYTRGMIAYLPQVGHAGPAWPLDITDPTLGPDALDRLAPARLVVVRALAADALAATYADAVNAYLTGAGGCPAGVAVTVDAGGLVWTADEVDPDVVQRAVLVVLPGRLEARAAARRLVAAIAEAVTDPDDAAAEVVPDGAPPAEVVGDAAPPAEVVGDAAPPAGPVASVTGRRRSKPAAA